MSFEQSSKKNNVRKVPLIEDNPEVRFSELQIRYLEFIKYYDEICEYEKKLNNLVRQEYDKIKDDIHNKIKKMPEIIYHIDCLISYLTSRDSRDLSQKTKFSEQVRIINEKLKPKQSELSNLLNRIVEKEGRLAKRLSSAQIEDIIMSYTSSEKTDSNNPKEEIQCSFRESKFVIKELCDNSEYLRKRQEELENIKKVSSQVKDITDSLKFHVKEQGSKLLSIEENVIEANSQVRKAEFEIQDAEKVSKRSCRKAMCLSFFIFLFVAAISVILFMLLVGNE